KGCQGDTESRQVIAHPMPVEKAGPARVVLEGGQEPRPATATGSSSYVYVWTPATYLDTPSILRPTSRPQADITYTLRVTAAGGCSASDEVRVKLLLAPEIPNAFSPNGDGINDVWNIKYLDSYPGAIIQLFDRYGRLVFNSVGYNKPWDGKQKGVDVPVGVYYYVIDPKNGRKPMTGSVTIVR
ncbi:MAG TPA: gliding motility-associated C-terminal domain-containing protein, partial [Phnomibacter sp.]|nr:gliding motility-associated C-terminal domain-containing protein [Phnomibacter sp.]